MGYVDYIHGYKIRDIELRNRFNSFENSVSRTVNDINAKTNASQTSIKEIEKTILSMAENDAVITVGFINPKMFGAVGDGSHDDTVAIKRAVQAAYNSTPTGGVVTFSPGVYLISETIELPQDKCVSIVMNHVIIRQSVPLYPMIRLGITDGYNYTMGVYGNGTSTLDMDDLGGIGIQIKQTAGYSQVVGIQIRRAGHGIGVLMGDDMVEGSTRISLQALLRDVYIFASDSTFDSTGIFINTNDCEFNNVYIYQCKYGCRGFGGGHNFTSVHVWANSPSGYTPETFRETVGFDVKGSLSFGTLYLDSMCNGLYTNGFDVAIANLIYSNDLHTVFSEPVEIKIIRNQNGGTVKVGQTSHLTIPQNDSMSVKIIHLENYANTHIHSTSHANRISYNRRSVSHAYTVFDEANNQAVNKNTPMLCSSSHAIAGKYYRLGYIKAATGTITVTFARKGGFVYRFTMTAGPGDVYIDKAEAIRKKEIANNKIFYGPAVNVDNVEWIPIYYHSPNGQQYNVFSCDCVAYGETGFYPEYFISLDNAPTFDTLENLTEIIFN